MTRPPLADHSRFAQRVRRRYAAELACLPPGLPQPEQLHTCVATLRQAGHASGAALRITRALVLERLLQLDCESGATLAEVTLAMTQLAEFALDLAASEVLAGLNLTHGAPLNSLGQPNAFWIVGMGKLGARELNVSSDIDLIYVYEDDGDTPGNASGRGRISHQEYYARAVRAIFALVGDTTEHGFVFRVDLALRPNGNSGPVAVSLDALEEYLHVQGREWERFAWLKSRVVAPVSSIGQPAALGLRKVVTPFVFRRYLDYGVFDSLRDLHRQIRDHASKRSAGRPERANDVKLSRGGIREIEFVVQLLQVVHGGQFPELRTRPTLKALPRLVRAGLMPESCAQTLAAAYDFLRRVEHRIQYLDDQQTHVLPTQDADLLWVAQAMGFASTATFLAQLDTHREAVAQEFDTLLGNAEVECKACRSGQRPAPAPAASMDDLLPQLGEAFAQRLRAWREHPRVLALREGARARLMRLLSRTAHWVEQGSVSEAAAVGLVDWMEPLLRRESYLALLLERPNVHARLLRMLGAARWPAQYLLHHPGVIDELAAATLLDERFDAPAFEAELEYRRQALQSSGEDDDEALLNVLRRAHHAEVFRTLARDVEARLTVEQVADDLSALADAVLRVTTRWCWSRLKKAHRADCRMGIIAYGKLGGKELGYGSDLDLVFVYDDDADEAAEVYANLVRKLINWLTVKTGEGDLYEIDTALRPNGNAGLLVSSFASYAHYQQQRGSNTAWTWEHQAMARARCVLGDDDLHRRFDAVREQVLCAPRDAASLRSEVATMRARMASAHPARAGQFDVKHSAGGMIDAEFAVQYLVLTHAAQHPELRCNVGNIALLERAEHAGLLPVGVGHAAADAYRALRAAQHHARLNDQAPVLPSDALTEQAHAVRRLWQSVIESPT
jgi:glutamate-ammonia-ligase adenylyltransferase